MKKHELLKHAYDNYPKGTKFIGAYKEKHFTSNGNFVFGSDCIDYVANKNNILNVPTGLVYDADNGKWATIVNSEPEKIAVKVENEQEFVALMKYYDGLGLKSSGGEHKKFSQNHNTLMFKNNFTAFNDKNYLDKDEWNIVNFQDFAKQHNIKLPLIKSEDGVWLFEGDEYYMVHKSDGKYIFTFEDAVILKRMDAVVRKDKLSSDAKALSTKQSALDWIEKMNKPKEIEQDLYFGQVAFINPKKSEIRIMDGDKEVSTLSFGDINDLQSQINNALKQLNNEK